MKRIEQNFPFNLLQNKGFEDMVKWGSILFALFIIIWTFPGVLITSSIDYFQYLTTGQAWGISLIVSFMLLVWLKSKVVTWREAFKLHLGASMLSGFFILLGFLFLQFPITVRTLYKMFDFQDRIPVFYKSSPGEIKYFNSLHPTKEISSEYLEGQWSISNAKYDFQSGGQLFIERGNNISIGRWKLSNGILLTKIRDESRGYWVTQIKESQFSYKAFDYSQEYIARKN